jgi:[acyl-carrier-protein] S-malonyltransferase
MKKIAFLFAGQGAQYVGMGKELYDNFEVARGVFDSANEILGIDIRKLCFEGPEEELSKTENTQPCMMTTAEAIVSVLKEKGVEAQYAGGLSLGEYSALVYAGVFSFEDGLTLIRKRGVLMQNAVQNDCGGMAAILGLEKNIIEDYCNNNKELGVLEVANYNCPGQIVITGDKVAVEKAACDLKGLGALKTIVLKVSGPFHSSLMQTAGDALEKEIRSIAIGEPNKKVVSNFDNEYYGADTNNIVYKLQKQVSSSVRWEDNVRKLIDEGVEIFIEIGPGKALSGFMKKIDRNKIVYNVEDLKSLNKLMEEINN